MSSDVERLSGAELDNCGIGALIRAGLISSPDYRFYFNFVYFCLTKHQIPGLVTAKLNNAELIDSYFSISVRNEIGRAEFRSLLLRHQLFHESVISLGLRR